MRGDFLPNLLLAFVEKYFRVNNDYGKRSTHNTSAFSPGAAMRREAFGISCIFG